MVNKERLVVVGLGSIGRRHARLLARRADLRVELCENNAQALDLALREAGEPLVHRDFAKMIQTRPEMVVIATPHAFHVEQTIAAAAAGAHVLCEKPMSDKLESARRLVQMAQSSGRVVSFGFHLHFHPGICRLRALIEQGSLGKIFHFHCHVGSHITLVNSASRYQAATRGALLMDYSHQADLCCWLLAGRPRGVYLAADKGGDLELGSDPMFLAMTCDYQGPALATVHLNYLQAPEQHFYQAIGDAGWVSCDLLNGLLSIGRSGADAVVTERFSTERDPVYQAEHAAFLQAVRGERPPENPPEQAILSMEMIDAAMRSWTCGQRIPIE